MMEMGNNTKKHKTSGQVPEPSAEMGNDAKKRKTCEPKLEEEPKKSEETGHVSKRVPLMRMQDLTENGDELGQLRFFGFGSSWNTVVHVMLPLLPRQQQLKARLAFMRVREHARGVSTETLPEAFCGPNIAPHFHLDGTVDAVYVPEHEEANDMFRWKEEFPVKSTFDLTTFMERHEDFRALIECDDDGWEHADFVFQVFTFQRSEEVIVLLRLRHRPSGVWIPVNVIPYKIECTFNQ